MNESVMRTIFVAFLVCLFCSMLVSYAAVSLREDQLSNKLNDQRTTILEAAGIYNANESVESQFQSLTIKFINFETGELLDNYEGIDINNYDQVKYSRKEGYYTLLSEDEDIATLRRKENIGKIYILENTSNEITKIILPIRGYGLWGTLYGYIALAGDFNTVEGLEFYDHKETPGLGGEVDNPTWKKKWIGKKIYDNNNVSLEVIKGSVNSQDDMSIYKVDGLSGATITSRGVTNMIKFWFSDSGYKKALQDLKDA